MSSGKRFFGSRATALHTIQSALADARVVRIASAYFELSGYQLLESVLRGKEIRLLIGRGENQQDRIESVIKEFNHSLSDFSLSDRSLVIQGMYQELLHGRLLVSVGAARDSGEQPYSSLDARYLYHHAKVYIADHDRAVIGSANLSRSGLVSSIEAGIETEDPEDVRWFADRFDELYGKAESINAPLLEILAAWLQQYNPFVVYARSLLEVYGLPDSSVPESLPALAAYQRPVVSRALQVIQQHGGAMLIASTGLGKTIMAAHILAYLRMEHNVHSALVIAPAGLREMWRRTMRMARTSSAEFSYHSLSADDWQKNRQVHILEHELDRADANTLIIIDESHHLRNEELRQGFFKLRNKRLIEAVQKGARVLLMTATPYSRHINDLNAQLRILPAPGQQQQADQLLPAAHWRVASAHEISGLPVAVVLTAPTVVRYFSQRDAEGKRYVLFSGDERRFFPEKIHLHNRSYVNELDSLLLRLLQSDLLLRSRESDPEQEQLFGGAFQVGIRDPLLEARLIHQFCSSRRQVESLLHKLSFAGGFEKLRFAKQAQLSRFIGAQAQELQNGHDKQTEHKVAILLEVLKSHPDEKVVIFCVYRETARYVQAALTRLLPQVTTACTVDVESDQLEQILKAFAPLANEALLGEGPEDRPSIQILVATGALAEGFNLQDASVLINFDLPWTVLTLAQRMGRILRPWQWSREIHIYNLLPDTMQKPELYMAMNWKERLLQRSSEHSRLADIPVLVGASETDRGVELSSLANALQSLGESDLGLDEVLDFIEKAEQYQSSDFLDDIALLDPAEIKAIHSLPAGIRSSQKDDQELLYLLLDWHRHSWPVLFRRSGQVFQDSRQRDQILSRIRCQPDTPGLAVGQLLEPSRLDEWQQLCLENWAASHHTDPTAITIRAAMLLRP
ncbi:MAG: DEAD/DEAH box helicase family protein [Leptospiraceae bacterium]|nr:DEAD/DEAH box helicase family protein [Leptospiraceae bacterium]